ncbi:MAG TPA: heparinase II/III family protein [Pseudonocardia sp.]|nr:heparinase II/III family protein [Pseudonocardia sp.]
MDPVAGPQHAGPQHAVPEIPDRPGGWWHEYVCPTHGVELLAATADGFPCAYGCLLTGEPYAGAWAVLAHQAAARSLRRLAVAARAGHRDAGEAAVAGLTRYAALYERLATEAHPDAQGWMLSGRLFQQALTEAIWGTSLAHAVYTLAGSVDGAALKPAAELLRALRQGARDARDVLVGRDDFRNNYTSWLNASGASASRALALLGEVDQTAEWITGRHGVEQHAAAAVHPDGWEWEASSYYHVFVLRGYLLALRGQAPDAVPTGLRTRLDAMLAVVAELGTDAGRLPALHDTPYAGARWDDELYELCLLGARLPGSPSLRRLADPLAARLRPDLEWHWRTEEAADWFGTAGTAGTAGTLGTAGTASTGTLEPGHATASAREPRPAVLYPDAGYAVLRGAGYQAVLDYGPHGGSHGHLDKLALYLYGPTAPWQPAYGVPPYAHPLRREYYAGTAAHPTLTVDGGEQRAATGRLLYWRPALENDPATGTEVGAEADVFDGVRFERHVRTDAERLVDVVLVEADRDRELVLHLRTDVATRVWLTAGGARSEWPGDAGLHGLHTATAGAVLGTGPDLGPADDPQRTRPHLRWRAHGRAAVFASVYATGATELGTGLGIERTDRELTLMLDRPGGAPLRWSIPHRTDGVHA